MAKISDLSDGGSLLPTDDLVAVRSGANVKVKADNITVDRIDLGDNEKIRLGDSQDLEIYHDGSNSYVQDAGTGSLRLRGTDLRLESSTLAHNFIVCTEGGAVTAYHNDSAKLSTTSTGIDVSGSISLDGAVSAGAITVDHTDGTDNISLTPTSTGGVVNVRNGSGTSVIALDGRDGQVGINVTGTVTTDGLTSQIATTGRSTLATFQNSASLSAGNQATIELKNGGQTAFISAESIQANTGIDLLFSSNDSSGTETNKLRIAENGDISFYEDTGTTAKLFWDASAESLGIGTTSPAVLLDIKEGTAATDAIIGLTAGTGGRAQIRSEAQADNTSSELSFYTMVGSATSERMRIDSSGNVGIGTSSPAATTKLHISGAGTQYMRVENTTTSVTTDFGTTSTGSTIINRSATPMMFFTDSTERVRIDALGNASFNTTNISPSANNVYGTAILQYGGASMSRVNSTTLDLNRSTSDGTIVNIRKDGTTVGSIGTNSGYVRIGTDDTNLLMHSVIDAIVPHSGSANRDAAIDLGYSGARFKDLHLSGNAIFADNGKAIFGSGSDLQIYHDGTHSYVADAGTGSLFLRSGSNIYVQNAGGTANYFKGTDGGAAELFHNGSSVLATTATGIDVTGSVTIQGSGVGGTYITSSSGSAAGDIKIEHIINSGRNLNTINSESGSGSAIPLALATGGSEALRITSTGNVGIGISPAHKLSIFGTGAGNATVQIEGEGGADPYINFLANNTQHWSLGIDDSDADKFKLSEHSALGTNDYFVVDVTGNVGIGTSSPSSLYAGATNLVVGGGTAESGMTIYSNSTVGNLYFADGTTGSEPYAGYIEYNHASDFLRVGTAGAEAIRIDDSGNLLVGTTDSNPVNNSTNTSADDGVVLGAAGTIAVARYNNTPFFANRTGTDGTIIDLRKSGTTVGIIGSTSGSMYIEGNPATGTTGLTFFGSYIGPRDEGAAADAAVDLGISSSRFRDLYLSGKAQADTYQFAQNSSATGATEAVYRPTTGALAFKTNSSEAMRIDSSGNLMVGKTSSANAQTTVGHLLLPDGRHYATASGGVSGIFSRTTSDGDILSFFKDGAAVGSIGSIASDLFIAEGNAGLRFDGENNQILPSSTTASTDGTCNLGATSARFKDLHLSTSVALRNDTSVTVPAINFTDTDTSPGVAQTTGEINWIDSHSAYGNTGVKMYGQYTVSGMHTFILETNDANTPANLETRLAVNNNGFYIYDGAGSEAARFDGSGNLLVGKTSTGAATAGIELNGANDLLRIARDGGVTQELNRITSDGDIIEFRKDNSPVGSIGTRSSGLVVGSGDTGLFYDGGGDRIFPESPSGGAARDAAIDLGTSAAQFKNLYLSGGVIFGATAGDVTSKTLDDYEEGTYTPAFLNVTSTATSAAGSYTKIGRVVFFSVNIDLSALDNTDTSGVAISLPFTSSGIEALMTMDTSATTLIGNADKSLVLGAYTAGGALIFTKSTGAFLYTDTQASGVFVVSGQFRTA